MRDTISSNTPIYILNDGRVITGTMVWYSVVCMREVWLLSRDITSDQDDPLLDIGRAIHESMYSYVNKKEIALDGIKIDMIIDSSKDRIVCEIKSSSKYIKASSMQLLYYLYRLEELGIHATGNIMIPKEKKRIKIMLTDSNKKEVENQLSIIKTIIDIDKPPKVEFIPYCRRCAYRYFCWSA
jgi:CRISPR-associated exonuclease Cas4